MIGPGFQEMNILFVLTFENNAHRRIQVRYFLPTAQIKCWKNRKCKNPKIANLVCQLWQDPKSNKEKLMPLSKWMVCDSKNSTFIKKQGASGLISNLGLKTPWGKIPLSHDILF